MDGDAHSSAAAAAAAAAAARWWGPTAAAVAAPSASTDVMNQLCRVCGEPAAGFHFGAFTCEGCKSFFGRTYNNLSSISECKNDGKCVINKKNRTSCKACRLRKCLMVGMSKSGSRYGRRSNWFKIHCLLQEQHQQQQQQQQQQQASGGNSHPALGDAKNSKGAPAIWDSISPFGHHDGKQQSPNAVMDVDNNNTSLGHKNYVEGKTSRMSSGGHMMPVRSLPHMAGSAAGYGSPGEAAAAAALWATRNTLLPIQMSTHPGPIPHLPVPFLASPFLHHHGMAAAVAAASWNSPHTHHPSNVPPAPRNFVLPFVQSVTSPKRMASSPATSSSSSAASHSSSLASSPFQPPDGKAGRRDSPELHNNRLKPFSEGESPSPSIHDKSLAMLQSLGPVQEQPIDLSLRGTKHRKKRRRRKGSVENSNSSERSGGYSEEFDGDSEGGSDSSEENGVEELEGKSNVGENGKGEADNRKTTSTPLDLTTRT